MARIDLVAEKRRIRLRIGRTRRRIDRRLRGLEREVRRMVSWRTWARQVPPRSVALGCVALVERLESSFGVSRAGWLSLLAAVFVTSAALVGWLSWRAFRRRFTGLQETLEELHEDAVWIGEWMKKDEP